MVIVKGMKMPESCNQCPMQSNGFCWAMPMEAYDKLHTRRVCGKKPEWCPLVSGNGVAVVDGKTYVAKSPRVTSRMRMGEITIGGFDEDDGT